MPGGGAQGGYFHIRRSGGLDLTSSLEAKFGVRSGQVHQIRGKTWEVLLPQDAKFGEKIPILWSYLKIQRAKFGVFVTYIFGGKIWGSNKNFRGKFLGQAPRSPNMKVPPPPLKGLFDFWNGVLICLFGVCNLGQARLPGV